MTEVGEIPIVGLLTIGEDPDVGVEVVVLVVTDFGVGL
jgi:hypothetical protein